MRLFGLIGYPLGHSFSKRFFSEKFEKEGRSDCRYELFPLPALGGLPALLASYPDLEGLKVTIPHKVGVLPYLSACDPISQAVGAVNTIAVRGGKCLGYNTDGWGFQRSLEGFIPSGFSSGALVLGTGGASRAVCFVLERMGIRHTLVSRTPGPGMLSYRDLDAEVMERHLLVVQATPAGMSPEIGMCPPIPFHFLSGNHYLYDLIYNPTETLFMECARSCGCKVKNGLEMLYLQAERSWEIWNS